MKFGIILETKEYEKAWNAVRFAVASKKRGHGVKLFLMGEAVECETLTHEVYDVAAQIKEFNELDGEILSCGTCLESRNLGATEVCSFATMIDCIEMVEWADKVINF